MKTTLIHHSKKLPTLIIACLDIHNHIYQQPHRFLIVKYYVVSYKEIIERIGLFFGNLSATSIMLTGNGIKSFISIIERIRFKIEFAFCNAFIQHHELLLNALTKHEM